MGAWADLDQSTGALIDEIEGLAEELLTDRASGSFDQGRITAKRVSASKSVVRRKILTNDDLAGEVDRYDDVEGMLDAIMGNGEAESLLIEAVGYAFLHVYSEADRLQANAIGQERADDFEADIEEQIEAIASVVPYLLDWESDAGGFQGGAITSSLSRYDLS